MSLSTINPPTEIEPLPPHSRLIPHETSRSDTRQPLPRHKQEAVPKPTDIPAPGTIRAIGHKMLLQHGGNETQWTCLDILWSRESRWDPTAANNSSGAYGIPQALPAWKMESAGRDWRTNPVTQIRWGLSYIFSKYDTACVALNHSYAYGWY